MDFTFSSALRESKTRAKGSIRGIRLLALPEDASKEEAKEEDKDKDQKETLSSGAQGGRAVVSQLPSGCIPLCFELLVGKGSDSFKANQPKKDADSCLPWPLGI